jgi:hypothetical protein
MLQAPIITNCTIFKNNNTILSIKNYIILNIYSLYGEAKEMILSANQPSCYNSCFTMKYKERGAIMDINVENLITISEANQNFSIDLGTLKINEVTSAVPSPCS